MYTTVEFRHSSAFGSLICGTIRDWTYLRTEEQTVCFGETATATQTPQTQKDILCTTDRQMTPKATEC
jgi:hypothetical protein